MDNVFDGGLVGSDSVAFNNFPSFETSKTLRKRPMVISDGVWNSKDDEQNIKNDKNDVLDDHDESGDEQNIAIRSRFMYDAIRNDVINFILILLIIVMFVVIVFQQISIHNKSSLIKIIETIKNSKD